MTGRPSGHIPVRVSTDSYLRSGFPETAGTYFTFISGFLNTHLCALTAGYCSLNDAAFLILLHVQRNH